MEFTPSPGNKLSTTGLRLSFFKLDTHHKTEDKLKRRFRQRILGNGRPSLEEQENLAFYTVMGAFDSLCIYPNPEEHRILYGGTLEGVQFFSNVTCICTEQYPPQTIIRQLNSKNCLMIVSATLRPDILAKCGILHEPLQEVRTECAVKGGFLFHLRSMSWGEQIFLLVSDRMDELLASSQCLIHHLKDRTLDLHSILAFRNEFIREAEQENSPWDETLGEDISLSWEIRIKRGKGVVKRLNEFMTSGCQGKIQPSIISWSNFSLTGDTQLYRFRGTAQWSSVFRCIRAVRDEFQPELVTTELKLEQRAWEKLQHASPLEDNATVIEEIDRERELLLRKIALGHEDCSAILENLGDRAGKLVIQALYTVSDAAQDYPYYYVIRSLLKAAVQLKLVALSPEPRHPIDIHDDLVYDCLQDAVSLMDAVRQRLAGVPVTRERAKTAFEAPPPSLRIHYEALEYVVASLLESLDHLNESEFFDWTGEQPCSRGEMYKPYIIVNITTDSPGHHFLKILMPEHCLTDVLALGALTHEALHHYIYWRLHPLFSHPAVRKFNESGNLNVVPYEKIPNILQEFIVEIFDFILTYRSNMGLYIQDVWSSYSSKLIDTVRQDLRSSDTGYYILRTLVVRLWSELALREDTRYHDLTCPEPRKLILKCSMKL